MRKKTKTTHTPRTAKTFEDLCEMPRDNVTARDWWLITDGYFVTVAHQRIGEAPQGSTTIPRHVFEAFVDWYQTGVWKRPRERKWENDRDRPRP